MSMGMALSWVLALASLCGSVSVALRSVASRCVNALFLSGRRVRGKGGVLGS